MYDNVGALFQELLLMNYQEQTIKFGETQDKFARFFDAIWRSVRHQGG